MLDVRSVVPDLQLGMLYLTLYKNSTLDVSLNISTSDSTTTQSLFKVILQLITCYFLTMLAGSGQSGHLAGTFPVTCW